MLAQHNLDHLCRARALRAGAVALWSCSLHDTVCTLRTLLLLPVVDCAWFCLRGMDDSCQTYVLFPANSITRMNLEKYFQVSKYLGP